MFQNAIPHFICKVEAAPVIFQPFYRAYALFVMAEAPRHHLVQRPFTGMSKRGVPQIVRQGDRLRQVLVEPQGAGDGTGNL